MTQVSASPSRHWETTFESWSVGPGTAELAKCENAERAVKKAIAASEKLSGMNIRVFAQGSYRNRTNVKIESDVDICVCLIDTTFSTLLSDGLTDAELGLVSATYTAAHFRNDVEKALQDYFGSAAVSRGNKAFDVHANTYRVDADVVPAIEHRWYFRLSDGSATHISGTAIYPDDGGRIINWPEQNYKNGVEKNDETNRHYKRVIRILKRLRNEIADNGIQSAKHTPSFLIDCLVWNVPNDRFNRGTYRDDVRGVLAYLFNNTRADESCKEWCEVNGIKYLFRPGQPWTRQQVQAFVSGAWDYLGLE